jgi:hypothetical protein
MSQVCGALVSVSSSVSLIWFSTNWRSDTISVLSHLLASSDIVSVSSTGFSSRISSSTATSSTGSSSATSG